MNLQCIPEHKSVTLKYTQNQWKDTHIHMYTYMDTYKHIEKTNKTPLYKDVPHSHTTFLSTQCCIIIMYDLTLPPKGSALNHNHSLRHPADRIVRIVYAILPESTLQLTMIAQFFCQSHALCHVSFLFI